MRLQRKAAQASSAPVVAFQGMYGAYSEAVALEAVPGCEPLPCEQFETAFQVLSQWLAEHAVLPIESSAHGSIHTVYDLLIRRSFLPKCMAALVVQKTTSRCSWHLALCYIA